MTTKQLELFTTNFELTEVGLNVKGKPDFEDWMEYGQSLKQLEGTTRQFAIGDWIVAGFDEGEYKKWDAIEKVWGDDSEILRQYERVAKIIEVGTRVPSLDWSHHREVVGIKKLGNKNSNGKLYLTDEPDQDAMRELLQKAIRPGKKPLPVAQLSDLVSQYKRRQQDEIRLANEPEKYSFILADPAWEYDFSLSDSRQIDNQYLPSSLTDMKRLRVPAAEDCVIFMWATSPKLNEAMELMQAWGFEYKTCMIWVKDQIGMGYYARQKHELVLIGAKGRLELPDESVRPESVFFAPRTDHSEKPDEIYSIIETMYPTYKKLEMFARKQRPGWEVWGDEV